MVQGFEQEDRRPFAEHEPGAVLGEGFTRARRVLGVFDGECTQGIPGLERPLCQGRFAAPREHHLRLLAPYRPIGLPHRHGRRRAGGRIGDVRTPEPVLQRDPRGGGVVHGHEHRVGLDPIRAPAIKGRVAHIGGLGPAHTGAEIHPDAVAVLCRELEPRIG
jgi:hypothetical protein